MEKVLNKISSLRKKKGVSHEAMATNMNLSQAAYSKIEKGETKLSLERLYQIAEVLDTNVQELLGFEENFKQEIHEIKENENFTVVGHQTIENMYHENKETTEKLILSLNDQITYLKEESAFLRSQILKDN